MSVEEVCTNGGVLTIIAIVLTVLKILFIVGPIIAVIMISIDFGKNVISGNDDAIRKNLSTAIKRILACVALFFVPFITNVIVNALGSLGVNYTLCIENSKNYSDFIKEDEGRENAPGTTLPSLGGTSSNNKNNDPNDPTFKITKDKIVLGHYNSTVNKYTLVIKSKGKTVSNSKYKFESSNKAIASVNSKGVITGKFGGSVTITVTSKANKNNKQKVRVLVVHTLYTKVELTQSVVGVSTKTGKNVRLAKGTKGVYNGIGASNCTNGYLRGDTIKVNGDYIKVDYSIAKPYGYSVSSIISDEDAENFVNTFGFESQTKYLFWSNAGTGIDYMFTGKKGKWKFYRKFYINVGHVIAYNACTGVHFDMYLAEHGDLSDPKNIVNGIPVIYKRYYSRTNHTNPWHAGGSNTRLPASHGCTRFIDSDMRYLDSMYSKIYHSSLVDY